ncbi:MAG: hypothetical protein V4772_08680 [Pseudomonadota bacterium]
MKYLFLALLLTGCANIKGVEITDDERKACGKVSCSVWTETELSRLARKFFQDGYKAGKASI